MSLFHTLLYIKPVKETAMKGHGFWLPDYLRERWRSSSKKNDEAISVSLPEEWTIVDGQVVDLQKLSRDHPGGKAALDQTRSQDSTVLFHTVHSVSNEKAVQQLLQSCSAGLIKDFPEAVAEMQGKHCIDFDWGQQLSEFAVDLRRSVRGYFSNLAKKKGISFRAASKATVGKWALVAVLLSSYLLSAVFYLSGSILAMFFLPIPSSLLAFHTFHDASHGALSTKSWVNELFTYCSPFLEVPHEWRWQHVIGHHAFTNIADLDPDSKHSRRWVSGDPAKRWRADLSVILGVWSIAVPMGLQMIASFRYFFSEAPTPSATSVAFLVVHRLLFWIFPLFKFGFFWGAIRVIVPNVIFSIIFMLNTQLSHLSEHTGGEKEQEHSKCWYLHQIHTTVDIAPDSFVSWFTSGGLNLQVVHHCFPTVNHSHLPAVRRIVEDVCCRHGVEIKALPSYTAAFDAHVSLLASGHDQAPSQATLDGTGSAESMHAASQDINSSSSPSRRHQTASPLREDS